MIIQTGRVARPQKVVIYAPEGLGKTTLASLMPKPLFFDFEQGTHHIDVARVEPKTLDDFEAGLRFLIKSPQGFKSIILDTVDWLEELVIEAVCTKAKVESIEAFGYGKGYTHLNERFTELLSLLDKTARATGMHVVMLAHSQVKRFDAPEAAGSYDRYELKLNKQISPLVKEWADAVIFGNWEVKIADPDSDNPSKKTKAHGGKTRVAYCNHTASWDAKNRHGLDDKEPWGVATLNKILGAASVGSGRANQPTQGQPQGTSTVVAPAAVASPVPPQEGPVDRMTGSGVEARSTDVGRYPAGEGPEPTSEEKAKAEQLNNHTPAEKDEIPMGDAWRADFLRIVEPHKDKALAFIRARGEIGENDPLEATPEKFAQRVLKNPVQFFKAAGATV